MEVSPFSSFNIVIGVEGIIGSRGSVFDFLGLTSSSFCLRAHRARRHATHLGSGCFDQTEDMLLWW